MGKGRRKRSSDTGGLRRWIPWLVKAGIVLGLIALCLFGVYLAVFKNPVFAVKEVRSNVPLPAEVKLEVYGRNIFSLSLPRIYEELLKRYPFSKKIEIQKVLPNEVRIFVLRRRPVFFVRRSGLLYPIDEEGYVLEVNSDLPREVIELRLDPDTLLKEGEVVESEAVFSALELWRALRKLKLTEVFDFEYIDAQQPYELRIKLRKGPLWKIRGGNYEEKLKVFKERLLNTFLEDLPRMGPDSYVLFLEDGTITVNP